MKLTDIISKLEELSPIRYAEAWDNVGLLVGNRDKEIERIYIALDATEDVIKRAVSMDSDLILTHHPLIFSPLKRITSDDFMGRRLMELIRNDISLYSMHTNFDVMGMADAAADELGLKQSEVLDVTYEDEVSKEGFGRVGFLPGEMSLEECAAYVKERFKLETVCVYGDLDSNVFRVAILPGSGKSMAKSAIASGADVYITGDIGHHEGIDLVAEGLSVIDAGHFGIEKIFIAYMKEYLQREFPGVTVITHPCQGPFRVI